MNTKKAAEKMDISRVIGLKGGRDECFFEVLAEEWEEHDDYLAHKVERVRQTIRVIVAGNAVCAEGAIQEALGCNALASGPCTVDIFPGERLDRGEGEKK